MASKITFTTWSALKTEIKNWIASYATSGEFRERSITTPDGVNISFMDARGCLQFLDEVEARAEAETSELKKHRPMKIQKSYW